MAVTHRLGARVDTRDLNRDVEGAGPLLPPELVPVAEQPAKPRPANPLAVAGVVIAVVALLAGIALGVRALYVTTLLTTSLDAIKAASNDDIGALARLVPAETVATPAFQAALKRAPARGAYVFTDEVFSGDLSANFTDGAGARGSLSLRPAFDGFGEAALRWTGPPFGDGTGRVVLTLETDGWRVLYIAVGKKGVSFLPEDAKSTFRNVGR